MRGSAFVKRLHICLHGVCLIGSLTELVSVDLSRNRFSGGLPFRPALQPALHQMKFYGNEDLLAPDLVTLHLFSQCY